MKKLLLRVLALALGLFIAPGVSAQNPSDYGLPQDIQDCNILHCFNWSYAGLRTELPDIAAAGFGAIQLSPLQGNAATGAEWFYAYMPYDYDFRGNGSITSSDVLKKICEEAHKYGIKVIIDVVANHINGEKAYRHTWWNTNDRLRPTTSKVNYASRKSITEHRLGDYPDVNTEDAEVQARLKDYLERLKESGVDGIRWDAAKHIALPSEGSQFWTVATSVPGLYNYGEILDTPGGTNANTLMKEYTDYMSVSDNGYSRTVLNAVKSGSVPSSDAGWAQSVISPRKVVYWGESHDTFANENGETKNVSQDRIDRAWAIVACRNGASSLYLSRPFKTGYKEIKMGTMGSLHYKAKEIAEVNHFRNAMTGRADFYTAKNGVACITRQDGGAVIVVGKGGSRAVSIANGGGYCPEGIYEDKVSGNTFIVTSTTISGTTGDSGIAVLYDGSPITEPIVLITPEGGTFKTETIDITAELRNAVRGTVKVSSDNVHLFTKELTPGANTITIGEGVAYGQMISLNWDAYDAKGNSKAGFVAYLKADPTLRPADMPENFYILGQVNGNSWDPSVGVQMEEEGPTFYADVTIQGAFSFASELGTKGAWNAFNSKGVRYGAAGSDKALLLNQGTPFEKLNDPKAFTFKAAEAGKTYRVTIQWNDQTVTISDPAGISGVEIEDSDAPVEYFNLQGIRVAEPTRGLYIKRQGSKTSKVYIR